MDEGGKAADEIDAHFFACRIERAGNGRKICHQRHGRHGDALVDDGDTVFALELLGGGHQLLGGGRQAVVDLTCHDVHVFVRARSKVEA